MTERSTFGNDQTKFIRTETSTKQTNALLFFSWEINPSLFSDPDHRKHISYWRHQFIRGNCRLYRKVYVKAPCSVKRLTRWEWVGGGAACSPGQHDVDVHMWCDYKTGLGCTQKLSLKTSCEILSLSGVSTKQSSTKPRPPGPIA